jgi:1-(5-phosphoribosyl)-5-[(5-phosphoribosylamino)methylideneamino] imidazole-4-carboxamide isomerase/N-(5'phosphoribosyl)anthranilate isomerase
MTFTLYPAVDIRDGRAVRLVRGAADAETVEADDPVAAALRWRDLGAEWLHVVDLDAAFTGEPRNRHLVAAITAATGLPVQASGGIRSLEDVEQALGFGAARVVLGTRALEDPAFVGQAVAAHGARIAVGLDAKGRRLKARGWTEEGGDLFDALRTFTRMGVARFVFTDIDRDGTLTGPNIARLAEVAQATSARVTASGGVAGLDDLRALAAAHERVDGVIVGKALYAGRFTLPEALQATRGHP